jgi:hypothetical protein
MSKPDYAKWIGKELWTLIDAAYLLSDQEPLGNLHEFIRCVEARKPAALIDIYDDLKNAGLTKSLRLIDPGYGTYVGHQRVKPSACIEWAIQREMAVPVQLLPLANVRESTERTEATQLRIIGALLQVILGNQPNGKPNSAFRKQTAIIEAVCTTHPNQRGLSKRNLEDVFAQANRVLSSE